MAAGMGVVLVDGLSSIVRGDRKGMCMAAPACRVLALAPTVFTFAKGTGTVLNHGDGGTGGRVGGWVGGRAQGLAKQLCSRTAGWGTRVAGALQYRQHPALRVGEDHNSKRTVRVHGPRMNLRCRSSCTLTRTAAK